MTSVRGCQFPDELFYDVHNNMWYREEADNTIVAGMTQVAVAMAGQLVAVTPKKPGRSIKAGKSCATIESGKWVGPAKLAFEGEIVEINEALITTPKIANSDPYNEGWLVKVKSETWAEVKPTLIPGSQVADPYEAKMAEDGFEGCAPAS